MSTVKDVAEHCGETIHRLRALIRAEAGEDGKSLGADTIGELRGLVETIADLDRMLKRVTDVERDPDVLDVTQIYALLDETPHDRAGDVLRVHALDERKDGSLEHGTPADPDVVALPEGAHDVVGDVLGMLSTVADLQSSAASASLAFEKFFETTSAEKEPLLEIAAMKGHCDTLVTSFEDATCFQHHPKPMDLVDVHALHAPSAMEEVYLREAVKREEQARLQGSAATITHFIRKCGARIKAGGASARSATKKRVRTLDEQRRLNQAAEAAEAAAGPPDTGTTLSVAAPGAPLPNGSVREGARTPGDGHQQLWSASQYAERLHKQVRALTKESGEIRAKHLLAASELEVLRQRMHQVVCENRELRQVDHNPWPEQGGVGGPLWATGKMLSRPELETDVVLVHDREVGKPFEQTDAGMLLEQLEEVFERAVDMHSGDAKDAHRLEQLVCDTGAVVCFISRGCMSNWHCVLCLRAAVQYGKKVVLLNNPKYFPNEEAQPQDLRDLFVAAPGEAASISFHKDFAHAAARECHRRLSQRAEAVAEELATDSDEEDRPEHLQRLDVLFRSYLCFKRSTGQHTAGALIERLHERYRMFCDESGQLRLHQLKKMVSSSRTFMLVVSQDVLSSHWAMSELRRAVETQKPIILVKDDSFPVNLPARFPPDAQPVEKILRREWDRVIVLESDAKTGQIKPESLDVCCNSIARRLGPSDQALATICPFVDQSVLNKFFLGSIGFLNLRGASIGSTGLQHLVEGLQYCPNLRGINLTENRVGFMAFEGLVALGEALRLQLNPSMTHLDLSCNDVCGSRGKHMKGLRAIMLGLEEHASLTHLSLANNKNLTNFGRNLVGINAIAACVRMNRALVDLDLSANALGLLGTENLARGLRNAPGLTALNLRKNMIGRDGQEALLTMAEALTTNTQLTFINLASNFVGDDGAQALATMLESNRTITSIDLSRNDITPDGVPHLSLALQQNNTLAVLDLRVNDIRKRGANSLLDALQSKEHPVNLSLVDICGIPVRDMIHSTCEEVDLSNGNVGVCECVMLTALIEGCKSLQLVNIQGNTIRDDYRIFLRDVCADATRARPIKLFQ